jgi:hypothetical protein
MPRSNVSFRIFDDTAKAVEQAIRTEDLGDIDGSASARRELEAAIGQSVHLVYVPNMSNGVELLTRIGVEELTTL